MRLEFAAQIFEAFLAENFTCIWWSPTLFARTTSSWIQSSMLSNIEISENLTFVVCFFWTCSVSLDADLLMFIAWRINSKRTKNNSFTNKSEMKCCQLQPCNPPLDDDDGDDGDEHHSMLLLQHQVLDEVIDGEYLILNIVVSCCCCDFCYLM